MRRPKQSILILITVAIAFTIVLLLLTLTPETKKIEPEKKVTLVKVIEAVSSNQPVIVSAYGTVQPDRELKLRAEVGGRVIEISENLVAGGIVKKDEILLKIDPRDYEIIIQQEKAAVEKAHLDLEIETGRQVVAKREWDQLTPTIKTLDISEKLALRKPHLVEKQVSLEAAKSRLEKAELDYQRTVVRAPMNSIITEEAVELGDVLTPQSVITTLVGTNEFRVQVSVPVNKLPWIEIPSSKVTVTQEVGNGKKIQKNGKILRLLGDLDPSGRMARLLVSIKNPLGLQQNGLFHDPYLIGSYVNVEFEGKTLEGIYEIPREAIRDNDTVWIINENQLLEVRPVNIIQRYQDHVIIEDGLEDGEKIVISSIPLVLPGMELKEVSE